MSQSAWMALFQPTVLQMFYIHAQGWIAAKQTLLHNKTVMYSYVVFNATNVSIEPQW